MKKNERKFIGVATIGDKEFCFDSNLPIDCQVLPAERKMQGCICISTNACVRFAERCRVVLPPEINNVAQGDGYKVKRTTRHYIIQLKVPVVEHRTTTEQRLVELLPVVLGEITLDRRELFDK